MLTAPPLLSLSGSLTFNQAPTSDADFWFIVAQGLIAFVLLAGGFVISRVLSSVSGNQKLLAEQLKGQVERMAQLDKEHTDRHTELLVEVTRMQGRVDHLEERHAV